MCKTKYNICDMKVIGVMLLYCARIQRISVKLWRAECFVI